MRKEQAAKYLGVSVRMLAYYVEQGRIKPTYEPGQTRSVAIFAEADLNRLKNELAQEGQGSTRTLPASLLAVMSELSSFVFAKLGLIAIAHRPLLSLREASELTGISLSELKQAIDEKKLKATARKKEFTIKRTSLDAYIEKYY